MSLGKIAKIAGIVAVGGPVGAGMYFWNEEKVKKAEKRGEEIGAAKEKARNEEIRRRTSERYEEISFKLTEFKLMCDCVLALASVGHSCAASKGHVTAEEKAQIDEFIVGVSKDMLPSHIRAQMDRTASNPPDVKTAYAHAAKIATPKIWPLFDEIVYLVTCIDQAIPQEKVAFASEWHFLRKAA